MGCSGGRGRRFGGGGKKKKKKKKKKRKRNVGYNVVVSSDVEDCVVVGEDVVVRSSLESSDRMARWALIRLFDAVFRPLIVSPVVTMAVQIWSMVAVGW